MAQNVQIIADKLLKEYPDLTDRKRLSEFARGFQTWYTGGWVGESSGSAYTFFNNHGGSSGTGGYVGSTDGETSRYENLPYNEWEYNQLSGRATILTKSSAYRGQKDFQSAFRDPSRDGKGEMEDQTHHFAPYFALGIAGLELAKNVAMAKDKEGGDGDRQLGERAFMMGQVLRCNSHDLI